MTTRLLVDIENLAGAKQGYGPITSATNWQGTARMNRAGDFSFSMPATDAMAAYVRPKSYARCYHADGLGMRCLGYGRIERVELRESEQGPLLQVSGSDLLGELGDRIINDRKAINAEITEHPTYMTAPRSTLNARDNAVGDISTYVAFKDNDAIVIGSIYKFHKINVVLTPNSDTHTLAAQYWTGTAWQNMGITDGTNGFSQSGTISFAPQTNWQPTEDEVLYFIKLFLDYADPGNPDVNVYDVSVTYYGPTDDPLNVTTGILAYAPSGWNLDEDGYSKLVKRPLTGTELMTNYGFETYVTSGSNDVFTNWTNMIIGDCTITADTTNKHGGSAAIKITTNGADPVWNYAGAYQTVAVMPSTEYTLAFWTRGDGSHDGQYSITDAAFADVPGYPGIAPIEASLTGPTDTLITGTTWTQVTRLFVTPENTTSIRIYFWTPIEGNSGTAPYCLFDDVSLQAGGGNSIYLQCSDESVLEMLIRCSEVSGENFILSPHALDTPPQRKVLWLGKDETDCGIEAVSFVDPVAAADNQFIALITAITEIEDASEIVSRVYPYGSGMGGSRVTLANCTTQPPAGYVLSTTGNYIERTATTTALGTRVEVAKSWSDIVAQTGDTTAAAQNAANILMIQAVNWLDTHSCTSLDRLTGDVPRFFELSITKCETMIYPGYQIRVRHHRFVDGYHAVSIDRDLWITAATWRVDRSGVQTVGLEVATVPRSAINDALATATSIRRLIGVQAHNTASGY